MPNIRSGQGTAFFLFDVAEAINLDRVRSLIGPTSEARFVPKSSTPPYIQYQQPPLSIDGGSLGIAELAGFRARFKIFDYGVISAALTRPLASTWSQLVQEGLQWQEDAALGTETERRCRELVTRLGPAMTAARDRFVTEDYFVFAVTALEDTPLADRLIESNGDDIARLLRVERERLSKQERDEVLRHRISYLENDLVVPTWNAAFVYDTEAGAAAAIEILEFANSQLLEFRYYDDLLDAQLAGIYKQLQAPGWFKGWRGRRYTGAAQQVHSLFIDVNELTDRTENALKIAGDVYAARLYALATARLGLDQWKANVKDKLKTLDDIYRFAVEQTAMARGEFLELIIVLILVFELVLFFMGIMEQ
jgi:hypothetical protein